MNAQPVCHRQQFLRIVHIDSYDMSACDTSRSTSLQPPTLYVFNAASIVKPNAIDKLTSELIGYDVDIGVISKSLLKKKHPSSCVEIVGYLLFCRDRNGRHLRSTIAIRYGVADFQAGSEVRNAVA